MKLQKYPLDTQVCSISIESCEYWNALYVKYKYLIPASIVNCFKVESDAASLPVHLTGNIVTSLQLFNAFFILFQRNFIFVSSLCSTQRSQNVHQMFILHVYTSGSVNCEL